MHYFLFPLTYIINQFQRNLRIPSTYPPPPLSRVQQPIEYHLSKYIKCKYWMQTRYQMKSIYDSIY